jgi:hypothetical protein
MSLSNNLASYRLLCLGHSYNQSALLSQTPITPSFPTLSYDAAERECLQHSNEFRSRQSAHPFQDLGGLLDVADKADTRHSALVVHSGNALGLECGHQGVQLSVYQITTPHLAATVDNVGQCLVLHLQSVEGQDVTSDVEECT